MNKNDVPNKLLNLAIQNAKWYNDARDKNNSISIAYNSGYLDATLNALSITQHGKFYSYKTDEHSKIKYLVITTYCLEDNGEDKVELIEV